MKAEQHKEEILHLKKQTKSWVTSELTLVTVWLCMPPRFVKLPK